MAETLRPRVCPVGTTRHWEKGDVIKLHEGNKFHSGWYNIPSFPVIEKLAGELDKLAREFTSVSDPVNGETFLDEVIKNYKREEGQENGPFAPQDFKQYSGHYGIKGYSFRSEFIKRAMAVHRQMNEAIQEEMLNEAGDGDLSDARKAEIRERVRAEWKDRLNRQVDITEFRKLSDVIHGQWKFLQKSRNLSEDDRATVDFIANEIRRLTNGTYDGNNYFQVVDLINRMKEMILEKFNGNWLLLDTQLDKVDAAFQKYLNAYSLQIKEVISEYSRKHFQMDIEADPETFYSQLEKKLLKSGIDGDKQVNELVVGSYEVYMPKGIHGNVTVSAEDYIDQYGDNAKTYTVRCENEALALAIAPYLSEFRRNDNILTLTYDFSGLKGSRLFDAQHTYAQSMQNLLGLIGKVPKPDAGQLAGYKKAYLFDKDITSFYKGHKLNFKLDYKVEGLPFGGHRVNLKKPIIRLDSVSDARFIRENMMNKLMESGFDEAEAEKLFDTYAKKNEFPVEPYDYKIILAHLDNSGFFEKAKIDFKPLLQMRFNTKYKKNLTGDWSQQTVKSLATIENVIDELPQGHVKTNNHLNEFMYDSDFNKAYAFYSADHKKIQFSPDCLRATAKQTTMDGSSHFKSVVVHEIGHAVSQKLARHQSMEYRTFANECGWSYKEDRTMDHATGDDVRIPRTGKNSHIPLITDYAHVSPEEAFAEFYSFYHNNKGTLDHWLETGDDNILKKNSLTVPNTRKIEYQETTIGTDPSRPTLDTFRSQMSNSLENLYQTFVRNNFRPELDMGIEQVNPWHIKYNRSAFVEITKSVIHAGRESNKTAPVYLIKNPNGTYEQLDFANSQDNNIIEGNRYLQRYIPAITISRRAYDKLMETSNKETIAAMMMEQLKEEKIPLAEKIQTHSDKQEGLYYDAKVVDWNTIRKCHGIIKQMKKMYTSDELKKAMDDLFGSDDIVEKDLGKSISEFFSPYKEKIKKLLERRKETPPTKKSYADVLIITPSMQILLCQRQKDDDFMAGKLCLPGGKVEEGEAPLDAAIRETMEETNIRLDRDKMVYIDTITNTDGTKSSYFATMIDEKKLKDEIVLDSVEQGNYILYALSVILHGHANRRDEFILDLAVRIKHLVENFDIIEKIFDWQYHPVAKSLDPEYDVQTKIEALAILKSYVDEHPEDEKALESYIHWEQSLLWPRVDTSTNAKIFHLP